ncbi:MAG TPA: putative metal-binding motif-containing protein [Xanthomonadales bacterium]|nr:putative metal-binding motif-containing protein [Xanthomonadales bacterium]
MRIASRLAAATLACAFASPSHASFHLMQIEQVIGGVAGDVTQQAVQLRMRAPGQNQVQFSQLRVFDAAGANPVLLVDLSTAVGSGATGDRVLIASPAFAANQGPAPDFVMLAPIPSSYLAGGRLSFEQDGGSVLYSLCWGSYAGSTAGSLDNDDDGTYGPCEPGPLPTATLAALRFGGSATALGTTNAADFSLTGGAAVFTNNAGATAAVAEPQRLDGRGGDCDDTNAMVFPGQDEVAGNRIDDDCDGLADEAPDGTASMDTMDLDGDGQSIADGDCNDTDDTVRRDAPEIAFDLVDNDCDRLADEDAGGAPAIDPVDHDGDGRAVYDRVFFSGFESPPG